MYNELTQKDIDKMNEELDYRVLVLRPQILEEVKFARSHGDLSENAEYHAAKRERGRNESRIRYLKNMIRTANVIEIKKDADGVGLFDKVRIYNEKAGAEKEIQIVTTLRQNALLGYVSKESPLGLAIMGRRVGDRVLVKVNESMSYYVVIKYIEKGVDNEDLPISGY